MLVDKIDHFRGEYAWLSNFTPCIIELDGFTYPTSEHAYQSCKSDDIEWKRFCANPINSTGQCKRQSKKIRILKNWEQIKQEKMLVILEQKFSDEPFKSLLLGTGDAEVIEGNNHGDDYWGVPFDTGKGQNKLGIILMNIREALKNGN